MFTIAVLTRTCREDRRSWRHLGFLPQSKETSSAKESLEFYHDCLMKLMAKIKLYQENLPLVDVYIDGVVERRKEIGRAHV